MPRSHFGVDIGLHVCVHYPIINNVEVLLDDANFICSMTI